MAHQKVKTDANESVEAISQMHQQEQLSKEEEHVQALTAVQRELESVKARRDAEIKAFADKLLVAEERMEKAEKKSTMGQEKDHGVEDIATLHNAHESKLREVEEKHAEETRRLEQVRPSRVAFLLVQIADPLLSIDRNFSRCNENSISTGKPMRERRERLLVSLFLPRENRTSLTATDPSFTDLIKFPF